MVIKQNVFIELCIFILLLVAFSCQDNDVCDDIKSPRLIIKFKNNENLDEDKQMSYVKVSRLNPETNLYEEVYNATSTDSILVPLLVNQVSNTQLRFYRSTDTLVYDDVKIQYTPDVGYTSRGCGFRRLYTNTTYFLVPNTGFLKQVIPQETDILDETKTHLHISF